MLGKAMNKYSQTKQEIFPKKNIVNLTTNQENLILKIKPLLTFWIKMATQTARTYNQSCLIKNQMKPYLKIYRLKT